jgi:hypothetical protein
MRQIATILFFALASACGAQVNNIYANSGIAYTVGAPTFIPGARGSLVAIDTATGKWWVNPSRTANAWVLMGEVLRKISGCTTPSGTPAKYYSPYVINECAAPELYYYLSGTWYCLNCASSGATNLSWSQITSTLFKLNSSTGADVLVKAGTNQTLTLSGDTLQIASTGGGAGTVTTDATLEGDGSALDPLKIADQGALTGQFLTHTGATWEPSWGNPYTFVTSGATITTDVNEVLVGTAVTDLVFGLPTCNASHDSKRFTFVFNGSDGFSKIIDPSGSQDFYDGDAVKVFFGKVTVSCTCRHDGSAGRWFYDSH